MSSSGSPIKWDNKEIARAETSFSTKATVDNSVFMVMEITLPFGNETKLDAESSLTRPFRKIFRDGKDPGRITYVFHRDDNRYYVLGSFCNTPKSIIFFMGAPDRKVMTFAEKEYYKKGNILNIDHFTLNKNLQSWHITFDEKMANNSKFPKQKTKQVDKHNFLWFVYMVRSLKYLESASSKITITHTCSKREMERIGSIIMKARDGAVWATTMLDDLVNEDFFWQFEFFVSNSSNQDNYPQVPITTTGGKGVVINDKRKESPVRIVPVSIPDFDGLVFIRISKIIGNLEHPIMFFSGGDLQYS